MPNLEKYSLDHEVRSSFEMGQLIPFCCQEVVPGDKVRLQSMSVIRLQPMLSPIMHRLDYYQRFYYVPFRLLIPNFEQLLTDPDSSQVVPSADTYLSYTSVLMKDLLLEKPLLEYFGLATSSDDVSSSSVLKTINALPLLAYYLIYNHYYMRSDLDARYLDQFSPEDFAKSQIRPYIGNVLNVNEGLDYYTSARTSTQYGNMVQLDMDGNNTITVPEMRLAESLQSFRERLLRVGGKYVNYIKEFFGVEPLDARVQIPKYLGGDNYSLAVSDVEQTAPSDGGYVGTLYGKSVSASRSGQISYDVFEHGLVIGLHFVRPRVSNIGGCPKVFTRKSYFDFFNPHFSHLGYQELTCKELDVASSDDDVFGYVPRYSEYRFGNDIVSGDFRRSLNFWHLSRDISRESLSKDFVTCRPDLRIFNYGDSSGLYDLSSDLVVRKLEFGIQEERASVSAGTRGFVEGYLFMPKSVSKEVFSSLIGAGSVLKGAKLYRTHVDGEGKVLTDGVFVFTEFSDEAYSSELSSVTVGVGQSCKLGYVCGVQVYNGLDFTINAPFGIPTFSVTRTWFNQTPGKDLLTNLCSLSFSTSSSSYRLPFLPTASFLNPDVGPEFPEWSKVKDVFVNINYFAGYQGLGDMIVPNVRPENNHVLSATYNQVDVLRPLPKYNGNILR